MDFSNKVVLITGSTGGLGAGVTQAFLTANATVVGFGSRKSSLESLQSKLHGADNFTGIVADLLDESSIQSATNQIVQEKERIDILLNLAGGFIGGIHLADTSEDQWDQMMAINAKSVFLCCKHIFPVMTAQKSGRIVNIAAKGGLTAVAGMSAYSASKAAVINLTHTIAAEGREHNVTANVVIPSIIDTKANRSAMPNADFSKWVTPQTISKTILFLCSDDAKDISGAVIPVYGRA